VSAPRNELCENEMGRKLRDGKTILDIQSGSQEVFWTGMLIFSLDMASEFYYFSQIKEFTAFYLALIRKKRQFNWRNIYMAETGNGKNVANFESMVSFVTRYGAFQFKKR